MSKQRILHGMSHSSEYRTWDAMKARCLNKKHPHYAKYGGRGILICEGWLNSFQNFFMDMGPKPSPQHSIDRINNNFGYFKENCRWATKKEQTNNKSDNIVLIYKNEKYSVADFAKKIDIKPETVYDRLYLGWDTEKIANTPPKSQNPTPTVVYNDTVMTLREFAGILGLSFGVVSNRYYRNWSIERIASTPLNKKINQCNQQ